MVDYPQRIEPATNASPVRLVQQTHFPVARQQHRPQADAEAQAPPFAVEDKVDLQLEPEAIRQLQPHTHLKFVVNDDTNRVIVQIIESETNQVLREVPPKSLSDALAALNGSYGKHIR